MPCQDRKRVSDLGKYVSVVTQLFICMFLLASVYWILLNVLLLPKVSTLHVQSWL